MIIYLMVIVLTAIQRTHCYKAVMLVPGINFGMQKFQDMSDFIKQKHPGTDVVLATFANGKLTKLPMWKQVHEIYKNKNVAEFLKRNPNGFHLFAHSQGSLISRALIEYYGLPVINYIIGAGVHMGYYGIIERWKPNIKKYHMQSVINKSIEDGYKILYNAVSQNTIFLAGYWREFKKNFSNISKLYLFDGRDDDVIEPWQSGHFEFITCNGSVVKTADLWVYKNDSFGLRSLFERNDVFHEELPHLLHENFDEIPFVQEYVLPLLT